MIRLTSAAPCFTVADVGGTVRSIYGDWEFEVKDPNGYVLVFSEMSD